MKDNLVASVLKDLDIYIVFLYQYLTYGLHSTIQTGYDNNIDRMCHD